jgi:hypothetical protein
MPMKHTFACGITATSHDGAGDLFLAGMMRQRDLEDGPTAQEREVIELRDNFRKAVNVIRALVIEAGGTVTLSERSLAAAYGRELVEQRDDCQMVYKLSVR